jgi:hypothetical protein
MKLFFTSLMIGTLVLSIAPPVSAQSNPEKGTSVGVATPRDPVAERKRFTQQAQDEVRIWEQKLHDFDTKMQAKATDAQATASKDLDNAWAQTKTAYAGLETAGEKDWYSAKTSFKKASDKLAVAWHKLNPADK